MSSADASDASSAPILVGGEALYDLVAGAGDDRLARRPRRRRAVQHRPHDRPAAPAGRLPRPPVDRPARRDPRARCSPTTASALECVVRSADPTTLALASLDAEGVAQLRLLHGRHGGGGPDAGRCARRTAAARRGAARRHARARARAAGERDGGRRRAARAATRWSSSISTAARRRSTTRAATARGSRASSRAATSSRPARRTSAGWIRASPRLEAARALLQRGPARGAAHAAGRTARSCSAPMTQTAIAPCRPTVVDTIGAGDAFGGGFLAWWISRGLGAAELARPRSASSRPRATARSSRRARSRRPGRRPRGCRRPPPGARWTRRTSERRRASVAAAPDAAGGLGRQHVPALHDVLDAARPWRTRCARCR